MHRFLGVYALGKGIQEHCVCVCESILVAVGMHVPVCASCMYICHLYLCLLVSIYTEIMRLKKKICVENQL